MRFDLWEGLFFNRGYDYFVSLRLRSIKDEKWEAAVAGDETEFGGDSQEDAFVCLRALCG